MNLNKAFILGNVTRDPEVRSLPSGQQVASFAIATNRFYTDASGEKKQEAEFHNIACFGKLADIASRYLTKGSLVLIEGRIRTRNWQNQQGMKQYRTEIIAEVLQLGPRGTGGGANNSQYAKSFQTPSAQNPASKADDIPVIEENQMPPIQSVSSFEAPKEEGEINVDDIPF